MLLQPFTLFSFNISARGFVLVGIKSNNNNNSNDYERTLFCAVFIPLYSVRQL